MALFARVKGIDLDGKGGLTVELEATWAGDRVTISKHSVDEGKSVEFAQEEWT